MGVSSEWFITEFSGICHLMGWSVSETRKNLIYEELISFEKSDFQAAFVSMRTEERFSFAALYKTISGIRANRIESETQKHKQEEEDHVRRWLKDHGDAKDECKNAGLCGKCSREYCDTVSRVSMKLVMKVIAEEITPREMHLKLAETFHGIGFERNVEGLEAF